MKKLFRFAFMLMTLSVGVILTTNCSSSDNDEETEQVENGDKNGSGNGDANGGDDSPNNGGNDQSGEPESPEDNLPEEARAFVGYWINQESKGSDFVFSADGVCLMMPFDLTKNDPAYRIEHTLAPSSSGYWTFNKDTNILATTTGGWQWQVTLSNVGAWAGVSFGTSTAQSFKKSEDKLSYMTIILSKSEWEDENGNTFSVGTFVNRNESTYNILGVSIDQGLKSKIGLSGSYIAIKEDENSNDYVFEYYYASWSSRYHEYIVGSITGRTITLKNPTNYSKQRLVFTDKDGNVTCELKRSITE